MHCYHFCWRKRQLNTFLTIFQPILLQCGHMFCETCLHHWNEVKPACPFCRSKIQCNVKVPIDSFMVEMFKLILSNCNMRRSRLIKPSEPTSKTDNTDVMRVIFMKIITKPVNIVLPLTENSPSWILKTSDTRTLRWSFNRRPDRSEVSVEEENLRN